MKPLPDFSLLKKILAQEPVIQHAMSMNKRERNIAHAWWDKRVVRFFRKSLPKRWYRRFRDIYLALCEIDSDFTQSKDGVCHKIHNVTKTCATYSGMHLNEVSQILQMLRDAEVIHYCQNKDEKTGKGVGGSTLIMYEWREDEETNIKEFLLKEIEKIEKVKSRIIDDNNTESRIIDVYNAIRNSINTKVFSKENITVPDGTEFSDDKMIEEITSMKRTIPSQPKKKPSSMKERILSSTKSKEASPQSKKVSEKLPPIDQMPQYMQVWFSLPSITKPSIKTYHRCIQLFDQLSKGKFPTKFQNLDKDWIKHNHIVNTSLNHKWLEEEFANLIDTKFRQMVEDKSFWPENKEKVFKGLTFENFVFNSHSGKSWLLMLYHQKKPKQLKAIIDEGTLLHDKYPRLTKMVCEEFDIHENRIHEKAQVVRFVSELIEFRNSFPVSDRNSRSVDNEIPKDNPKEFLEHIFSFFRQEYGFALENPNPSLLNLRNRPMGDYWEKAWSEDHGLPKPPAKYLQEWLRA